MAVFMQNTCTFDDCRLTFPTLSDLIYHIEYAHIEHDPLVNEQREASQPISIALSYAVRFTTDSAIRKYRDSIANGEVQCHISQAQSSSISNTPIVANAKHNVKHLKNPPVQADQNNSARAVHSEYSKSGYDVCRSVSECEENDGGSSSEDSDDSWNTEEYSSEFILRYGCRLSSSSAGGGGGAMDKPFACPVPGCKKRYKNINGIKYHSKNGHKKTRKRYKCHCGKNYRNVKGIKKHSISQHFVKIESPVVLSAAVPAPSALASLPPRALHEIRFTCAVDRQALQYRRVQGKLLISNVSGVYASALRSAGALTYSAHPLGRSSLSNQ